MTTQRPTHPDVVAARALGVGAGLIALMLAWLVGNRLTALLLDPPAGPVVALTTAAAIGIAVALLVGRRLVTRAVQDLNRIG